jgi:hypothetical protein
MPRTAAENGTKPTLTASDIGKSSKKSGLSLGRGTRRAVFRMFVSDATHIHQKLAPRHYCPSAAALPSVRVA